MNINQLYADLGDNMEKLARAAFLCTLSVGLTLCVGNMILTIISLFGSLINVFVKYVDYIQELNNISLVTQDQFFKQSSDRHYSAIKIGILAALLLYLIGVLLYLYINDNYPIIEKPEYIDHYGKPHNVITIDKRPEMKNNVIYLLLYLWNLVLMVNIYIANKPFIAWLNIVQNMTPVSNCGLNLKSGLKLLDFGTIMQGLLIIPFPLIGYQQIGKELKKDYFKQNLSKKLSEMFTLLAENRNLIEIPNNFIANPVPMQHYDRKLKSDQDVKKQKQLFCVECGLRLPETYSQFCSNCGKSTLNREDVPNYL